VRVNDGPMALIGGLCKSNLMKREAVRASEDNRREPPQCSQSIARQV